MPLGLDALVVVLAAQHPGIFWVFPPLVAMISLAGATLTYWVGRTVGYAALPRLVPEHHLERINARLYSTGTGALAAAAVMPPPFPLTAFLLTCGALDFDRRRFFIVFGLMRLVRFSAEALLAQYYGERLLAMLQTHRPYAASFVVVLAVTASIALVAILWRRTRPQPA